MDIAGYGKFWENFVASLGVDRNLEVSVLLRLYEGEVVETNILTKHCQSNTGTMTGVCDRLEELELVEQFRDLKDRRKIGRRLSRPGRRKMKSALRPLDLESGV